MRLISISLMVAATAVAQPTQTHLVDTAYFAFGNPVAKASCKLKLQPPSVIITAGITTMPAPLYYNFTGGAVDIYLTPSTSTYAITGTCTYGSGGQQGTVNVNQYWLIPVSGSPVTIADVLTSGSVPASSQISPGQISAGGAVIGNTLCFDGTTWVPGTCGSAGSGTPGTLTEWLTSGTLTSSTISQSGGNTTIPGTLTLGSPGQTQFALSNSDGSLRPIIFGPGTLSSFGSPPNGSEGYCTDCDTPSPEGSVCTASGDHSGAKATWIRGAARCF